MGKNKGHDGHLCSLIGCEDARDIAPLVVDPRFLCVRCGRAAHKKRNLCKGEKLTELLKT